MAEVRPDRVARFDALYNALSAARYACEIMDTDQLGLDLSTILFDVPSRDGTGTRPMSVTVLPDDGALDYADLVQAWISMGPAQDGDASRLADANVIAPIGHSAIQDGDVHHRHVWPIQAGQHVSPDMVDEWIKLMIFSADSVLAHARK
ncbi:hypothetical protein [uncultured Ruegeria sp.]|uniref:hypothetical protein n=1 Tax=uncultured Ruegeria sp. TaxID=259304 RepID=UPI00262D2C15|nr:hypothetical protein [uncultured Ruegeria sp.]